MVVSHCVEFLLGSFRRELPEYKENKRSFKAEMDRQRHKSQCLLLYLPVYILIKILTSYLFHKSNKTVHQ